MSRSVRKNITTPRSAGIRIPRSEPIYNSEFCQDFYNGPDENGDLALGTSDPDRYTAGMHDDIFFLARANKKPKGGKKTANVKKGTTPVSSKKIEKSNYVASHRTEKQSRHIPREYEVPAYSPGKSVEIGGLVGIPISETYLSVEARKIEQQITGKTHVDLIDLTSLNLTKVIYLFSHMSVKELISTVDLSHNSLKQIPECFQLSNISRFYARYNSLKSLNIKDNMTMLTELDLNSNDIADFPSVEVLERMPSLCTLTLYGNKIKTLPCESIRFLADIGLKDLNLSFNELVDLPNEICQMSSLRSLRLSNNYLKRLPRDIVKLKLVGPNSFDVTGNQLVYPPQDIAKLGMNNIRSYFSLENENNIRFNQFKLIVVGHEGAGKTSIISYLMEHNVCTDNLSSPSKMSTPPPLWSRELSDDSLFANIPSSGPSLSSIGRTRSDVSTMSDATATSTGAGGRTVGLEISTLSLRIPSLPASTYPVTKNDVDHIDTNASMDDIVSLSIWDFAGQEVYHSAHEVFFSAHALYLVVWNMTENTRAQIETKVQFWIDLIQVRAPGSKIIIVATRADECVDFSDDITSILMEQLAENEILRVSDIELELMELQTQLESLGYASSAYRQLKLKMALLKKSLHMRPHIVTCAPVVASTEQDGSIKPGYDIEKLVSAIRQVSTATSDEQNPFQLVNVYHPRFYGHVKQAAEALRSSRTIITMESLHEAALVEAGTSSSATLKMTLKETESAVAFLSCIGEVVWFRDRTLCPLEGDECSDEESHVIDEYYDVEEEANGSSHAETCTDDSATWSWVDDCLDIGSYVVLNPHWLLNAVKGVLTHELSLDVRSLRQSMGAAETDRKFGFSSDERNGIVRWPLIETLLSRKSEIGSDPYERKNTLQILRLLLEHFNIIVPIRMDTANPDSAGTPPLHHNKHNNLLGSPLTTAKSGIGSVLTVGAEVHKSSSTSDLLTPPRGIPPCPRANSGSALNSASSTTVRGNSTHDRDYGHYQKLSYPQTPIANAASPNSLETLSSQRGVSDPSGVATFGILQNHKRNKSVGDNLSSATKIPPIDVAEDYFLVPALLNDINRPTVPKYARPGQIRMERRFRLQRFVPPGLIPRIIACSYNYVKERPIASRHPNALNQCWKSAFSQKHGAVHIWLWLEDKVVATLDEFGRADRATIRVVAFGNFFGAKSIVGWLDKYCTAVIHVLKDFPGLCHLSQAIVCPTCIMSQHDEDDCGEFSYTELLNELEDNHPKAEGCCTDFDDIRFEHKQAMCDKRQCMIPFELLVSNPHKGSTSNKSISAEHQMERRLEYLTNEIIRLSSVPSATCEKAVASVAVAYIAKEDMEYIKQWILSGRENANDLSMSTSPVFTAYPKRLATGAFTRIPDTNGGPPATVVLSCAHFCIGDKDKSFPIEEIPGFESVFLVGDTENWLYMADLITLGTAFATRDAGDHLVSSQREGKPTVFNCSACLNENPVSSRCCSNCGLAKPGEGFWDVSALSLKYSIIPTPRLSKEGFVSIEPIGLADVSNHPSYDVCPDLPTREQSLRLLGLSGLSSLSSDFGRVMQIMNGLLLVNVYNDNGASGGPVLDRLGRLVGVLSCVNPNETAKAYIEPIAKFVELLQRHTFIDNIHDPQCQICEAHPLLKKKFCW